LVKTLGPATGHFLGHMQKELAVVRPTLCAPSAAERLVRWVPILRREFF
jgi:hypothetical protein